MLPVAGKRRVADDLFHTAESLTAKFLSPQLAAVLSTRLRLQLELEGTRSRIRSHANDWLRHLANVDESWF